MRFIKIAVCFFILGIIITQISYLKGYFHPSTAYAVGDLSVDWGIGTGNVGPVFTINNMAPGDSQTHSVKIKNNSLQIRPVGVRGIKTQETGNVADALQITISRNGTVIYGMGSNTGVKTLSQFFAESAGIDGILLFLQPSNNTSQYTFNISFDKQAGNTYQAKTLEFNLQIGLSVPVPEACRDIKFSNISPIYGTEKGEILNGTSGNDLISGFGGGDIIHGNGGDDCIIGANSSEAIYGDAGNDVIYGGGGGDALYGGDGNDTIYGEDGSDMLSGDNGNDNLIGENGSDSAKGGTGTDTCNAEIKQQCEL